MLSSVQNFSFNISVTMVHISGVVVPGQRPQMDWGLLTGKIEEHPNGEYSCEFSTGGFLPKTKNFLIELENYFDSRKKEYTDFMKRGGWDFTYTFSDLKLFDVLLFSMPELKKALQIK